MIYLTRAIPADGSLRERRNTSLVDGTLYFQCSDGKRGLVAKLRHSLPFRTSDEKQVSRSCRVFIRMERSTRRDSRSSILTGSSAILTARLLPLLACEDRAYNGVNVPTFVFGCPRTFFMPPARIREPFSRV